VKCVAHTRYQGCWWKRLRAKRRGETNGPLLLVAHGQFVPSLGPSPAQDFSAVLGRHALAKAVGILSLSFVRLVRSFHELSPVAWQTKKGCRIRSNPFLPIQQNCINIRKSRVINKRYLGDWSERAVCCSAFVAFAWQFPKLIIRTQSFIVCCVFRRHLLLSRVGWDFLSAFNSRLLIPACCSPCNPRDTASSAYTFVQREGPS